MSAEWALNAPDLDDIGYGWRREMLLDAAWTDGIIHWQRPGARLTTAACHGKRTTAPVTARRAAVTCGACKQSRAWQAAV